MEVITPLVRAEIDGIAATIAPLYALQGWTWHGDGVPSAERIAEMLTKLVTDDCLDSAGTAVEAGRLRVQRSNDGDSIDDDFEVYLSLGGLSTND